MNSFSVSFLSYNYDTFRNAYNRFFLYNFFLHFSTLSPIHLILLSRLTSEEASVCDENKAQFLFTCWALKDFNHDWNEKSSSTIFVLHSILGKISNFLVKKKWKFQPWSSYKVSHPSKTYQMSQWLWQKFVLLNCIFSFSRQTCQWLSKTIPTYTTLNDRVSETC